MTHYYPEFNTELLNKKFLVVGIGGNGTHLALALVRFGVKYLAVIDRDTVEPSNLTRQILYTKNDVGKQKATAAHKCLERNNLQTVIHSFDMDIMEQRRKVAELVAESDFVFSVVDKPGPRFFIASLCLEFGKPAIAGGTLAIYGFQAVAELQKPGGRPCIACNLLSTMPPDEWIEYYTRHDADSLQSAYSKRIRSFDESVAGPSQAPSTYITAATGSNIMMAMMLGYLMGKEVPGKALISLIPLHLETMETGSNPHCPLCGTAKR